jgi:uncharacterized RDD family membrane protein YckC
MAMTSTPDAAIELEPAGFWIRAGARLIDWMVQTLRASIERTTFIGWIGGVLASLAYHSFSEGLSGSTVGKRLLRLQIIDVNLTPVSFGQGAKRSVAFLLDALFFGMIAAHFMNESLEKQRIGDQWAETRVVRRRSLPVSMRTPTRRMIGGFAAAIA